jgi:hypothetical protein
MTKVFISSIITGMEDMRAAAKGACTALDLLPLTAEPLPASPSSPQGACLQMVRDSDAVILLLGRRYGFVQPSGKSATEEEFDEAARLGKGLFVFITSAELEPEQERFRQRVGAWQGGQLFKVCPTTIELQTEATRALRAWVASAAPADIDPVVKANLSAVTPRAHPNTFGSGGPWVAVSFAPTQRLHLDDQVVFDQLPGIAADLLVAGPHRITEHRPKFVTSTDGVMLRVLTAHSEWSLSAWLGLDAAVSIGVEIASSSSAAVPLSHRWFLAPDDLQRTLAHCFAFIRGVLDAQDPARAVMSGRLLTSLSRLGLKHLATPRDGEVTVPRRTISGDDRSTTAPVQPETVVRAKLAPSSDLAERYVRMFQRSFGEDDWVSS